MSTIVLNINDTIVSSDTIIVKLVKTAVGCQPCMAQRVMTTENDVDIVFWICCTLVFLGLMAATVICMWRLNLMSSAAAARKEQREKEREDAERKLKADMLDKYLDLLKEKASKNDKGSYDEDAVREYKQSLKFLIELSQQSKMKELSFESLRLDTNPPKQSEDTTVINTNEKE